MAGPGTWMTRRCVDITAGDTTRSRFRRLGGGVSWLTTGIVSVALPSSAATATPTTQEYFICPSVSTHNAHGMWVIGAHGA
jgi:hypothetical protein